MALLFRVVAFGKPRGPWRGRERQAQLDAVAQGLAEYDEEDGQFYLDGPASIEWVRLEDLRKSA